MNVNLPLGEEPEHPDDPRHIWDGLTSERAWAAWPCAWRDPIGWPGGCNTRRDEHADQPGGKFPELDITDHPFTTRSAEEAIA